MPRHHAPLLTSIWNDEDFQSLTPMGQRMYMQILSQKRLSLVGVVPYQPRNWARGCVGLTTADVERDVQELIDRNYVIVDHATEELMVRTMLKHDPPHGSRTIQGMWNAWREVDSLDLKKRIVDAISADVWAEERVDPPELAKDLRNTPSEGPSMGYPQIENESSAATCHQPPSTIPLPSSGKSSFQSHQGPVEKPGEIETTISHLSERFRA